MWSRIFIAIFLVLTVLPGLQMVTGLIPVSPVIENRRLAAAPALSTPPDRIPRAANDWFNDHFGLRPLLIKLKTQIDYSVFRTSDRVLVGTDGWMFYRSTVNVEAPQIDKLLATAKETSIVNGMKQFTEALQGAGIGSVLTINMMSDRFYGDKVPASAVRRPAHPRIDDLVDRLRALPSLHYVDSFDILRETMKQRQIFHKTDFHWNDPAAFPVAEAIVETISEAEGLPKSAWTHKLEIQQISSSGGIASFMPLFIPPSEMALMVKPTYTFPPGYTSGSSGIFESTTAATNGTPGYLPSTVFIGDSFFDGMIRSGIQAAFLETARVRWKAGLKLSDIAQAIPADARWCVIEFIEVNLTAMDAFADQDDVAKAVAILQKRGK